MKFRLTALCAALTALAACSTTVTQQGTLAELETVEADLNEVYLEDSLERAAQSYRRYLDETKESARTPEAMRRLADLQTADLMIGGTATLANTYGALIADVGTTLYRVGPRYLWQLEQAWENSIARDWSGHIASDLLPMLAGVNGLRAQEPEKQNRFKLSFYLDPARWNETLAASIRGRLAAANVRARLTSLTNEVDEKSITELRRSASIAG